MRLHPQTYAFTAISHERRRIFQRTANAELLIATIFRYRDQSRFLLHGFVVMPDHMHVLLTPEESIEKTAQLIKGDIRLRFVSSLRVRFGRRDTMRIGYSMQKIIGISWRISRTIR